MAMTFTLPDDVVYALFIVLSVGLGPAVRTLSTDFQRRWASTLIGFFLLWAVCGSHIIHLIITIFGNCILMSIFPPTRGEKGISFPGKSFIWNFGYLAVFRTVHFIGIPPPSPVTNAAQLFLTLKMVGLAFEVQDSSSMMPETREGGDSDQADLVLQKRYCQVHVKPLDVVSYAFCYVGLLTGPYYKYRTYQDWLSLPKDADLNAKEPLYSRLTQLPIIAACFLFFSYFFSIQFVETDEFLECPFWYRLFYMVPMFTIFRTRLYIAWIFSEMMCMTAGLGAYPVASKPKCGQGPTDYKQLEAFNKKTEVSSPGYNFETIHNIDIYGCDLAPMTKQGLRSWNMTVQFWLATFVHRRVPAVLKPYRVAVTMGVSAFWHGIHPGYYLSFLTVPPILKAEEAMIKAFRQDASPQRQRLFDWGCWFFKMRGFDYMCMGFLLLKLSSTIRYWYSIYFMGHLVMLCFMGLGYAFRPAKQQRSRD